FAPGGRRGRGGACRAARIAERGMSFDAPLAPWQQRVYDHAAAALDGGRMGHALLFTGPAMLGKRAVAERLAARVLCQATDGTARPCGQCRPCVLYRSRSQKDP